MYSFPCFCFKVGKAAARTVSSLPSLPATHCLRLIVIENSISSPCFWEAKWFWCLKRLIALKKKWIRCSLGPDPSNGRANRNPFVHLLSLAAVSPGATRLSLLWPSYCVMLLLAWPAKRRGAAPALAEKKKKKKGKQVAVPLSSFFGLCSQSSWNDWRMVMRERVHGMCQYLSGWQCWQGGII